MATVRGSRWPRERTNAERSEAQIPASSSTPRALRKWRNNVRVSRQRLIVGGDVPNRPPRNLSYLSSAADIVGVSGTRSEMHRLLWKQPSCENAESIHITARSTWARELAAGPASGIP